MNDRTIKQIAFGMLFIVVLSTASMRFWSAKTMPAQRGVPIEKPATGRPERTFRVPSNPEQLETSPEPAISADDLARIKTLASSEEDVLDWIRNWARKDPKAALTWAQQQPGGVERNEALTDACFQIAQTDPGRAVMLAEQLNLNRNAVLKNLAQQWSAKDLTAAYQWLVAQSPSTHRDAFASGMAFVLAQKEPLNAARFVIQEIPAGGVQEEAVMMVLHQWALTDFSAATAWVEQFPAGSLQNRAFNELLGVAKYEQSISQAK